ncbi:MAG: LolA-like putative outer membrane lipoprotein chaperone [Prevotella sp.]
MKRILNILVMLAVTICSANAQTAKQVLDKTAAVLSNKGGVTANFSITGKNIGTTSGKISVKGRMFHATTPQAMVWFNGKTQWTYMKSQQEVNVSNPTEAELQAINPYNFINIYKKGYSYTMKTVGAGYEVHLKATDAKRQIQEMYITVNKSTYAPSQVKMRQGKKWTTINVSSLKKANLSNSVFTFPSKDYPNAEVIDLR